jgi:hypothetical protein
VIIFRRNDGSFVFKGVLRGKLYLVDFILEEVELDRCLIAKTNILGLTKIVFEKDRLCGACQARKKVGVHHHAKKIMINTRPSEMLHMDLFGPVAYISIDGNKYGLVIIDNYSHFTWMFFLQDKSETQEVLKKFLKRVQNKFDAKVNKIRSHNSTEFKNTQVEDFLDEEGIKHEFLAPYTAQ